MHTRRSPNNAVETVRIASLAMSLVHVPLGLNALKIISEKVEDGSL